MSPKRFSASYAARFISCPGSADLENSIPGFQYPKQDEEKGARGKGTRLHSWLAETAEWSAKDLRNIAEALTYVADLKAERRFKVLSETTIEATWLKKSPHTTVDLVLYLQDELHIVDWKTGVIPVSPVNNAQLMYYALCFMHLAPKAEGAWLHIIQPWIPDGCASWWASAEALADFMVLAQQTEQKILTRDKTLSPSDHCTFCPAYPHSRSEKGRPLCPVTMQLLYPDPFDEEEVLAL